MNDFYQHKKSDKIKWIFTCIAFVLVFVMFIAMCLQLFGQGKVKPSEWFKKAETEQSTPVEMLDKNEYETPNDNISAVKAVKSVYMLSATAYSATEGVSKTLTAEIKPANAVNKAVDWAISWEDNSITDDISSYLTVTPTSDGALTATVKCLSSFRNKQAIVTVTTREGGFKAICYISYVGEPTSISVNNNSTAECNLGGSVSLPIGLSNVFNDVGSEFYSEVKVTNIVFGGTCSTAQKLVTVSGRNKGTVAYTNIKDNVSITELKYEGTSNLTDKFNITVSNGSLNISAPLVSNVYSSYSPAGAGVQDTYYNNFYGNWNGYADITVACGSLSTTLRVNFIMGVEGVSLTPNIQF